MREDERRRHHDRIRVVITSVSEPTTSDVDLADYLHFQVLATHRLRQMADIYHRDYEPWGIEPAARNVLPQLGPQLELDESIFENVIPGHWAYDRDTEDLCPDYLEACICDVVHILTGYYAQVIWRC
jgi:hypothetical protein